MPDTKIRIAPAGSLSTAAAGIVEVAMICSTSFSMRSQFTMDSSTASNALTVFSLYFLLRRSVSMYMRLSLFSSASTAAEGVLPIPPRGFFGAAIHGEVGENSKLVTWKASSK